MSALKARMVLMHLVWRVMSVLAFLVGGVMVFELLSLERFFLCFLYPKDILFCYILRGSFGWVYLFLCALCVAVSSVRFSILDSLDLTSTVHSF